MIAWTEYAELPGLSVSAHIHKDGTHSLGFRQYAHGGPQKFYDISIHFTADDIAAIAALLEKMKAMRPAEEEAEKSPTCEYCQVPAAASRTAPGVNSEGRVVDVCEDCADDLDRGAARAKADDIEECRGDYERDSHKMEFDQ